MRFRTLAPFLIVLVAATALAGCSHGISSSTPSASGGAPAGPPSFSQFSDVPIPDGARMDTDRSLLVGPPDSWVGRLVFNVRFSSAPELFDFFKAKMPGYQWQEISSVRADISVMTWQRGDRIATIQIEETTFGAGVTLTMGPVAGGAVTQGGAGSTAAPQPPAPAGAPPAPAVTQQPLSQ